MENMSFWKILRVLTTNVCNYRCSFCHNEGQEKPLSKQFLKFLDFKRIVDALEGLPLREIHFSGGEPFLNSETLKMIIYADKNTDYEIGCATNATLLNEEIIGQLSETRIKLNIQFPAINPDNFINITQSGKLDALLEKFRLLQNHKVQFGLNHVITDTNFESLKDVIEFAGTNNYPLKLLPDLNNVESVLLKDKIFPFLDEMTDARIDKQTGAIKWVTKTDNGSEFQVMYVDSPCFYKNFNICKNFAEIRLLPNMRLQTCIKKQSYSQSDFVVNNCDKESIKLKFQQAWNDFISC